MATATVKFNIDNRCSLGDIGGKVVRFYGTITFSAATDTYATGGLSPAAGFALANLGPYADRAPLKMNINSRAGAAFEYLWNVPTSKLQIFAGGGSGTAAPSEVTNATVLNATTPALSTDVIEFEAIFPRL